MIMCYDLENVTNSALWRLRLQRKSGRKEEKEEEGRKARRKRQCQPQLCSVREHLRIRKRTGADSSGWTEEPQSRVFSRLAPMGAASCLRLPSSADLLFAGPLTEARAAPRWDPSQGPPASAAACPSLSPAGPWDGILTVGTTDVRPSVSQLCAPGLKSTGERERRGVEERKQKWAGGKKTEGGKIGVSCTDRPSALGAVTF